MHALERASHGFRRRSSADVNAPVLSMKTSDRVSQKIERLFRQSGDRSLGLVHLQPEPRHECFHSREHSLSITRTAADHKVVGVIHDIGVQLFLIAMKLPCQQEATKRLASSGDITPPCGIPAPSRRPSGSTSGGRYPACQSYLQRSIARHPLREPDGPRQIALCRSPRTLNFLDTPQFQRIIGCILCSFPESAASASTKHHSGPLQHNTSLDSSLAGPSALEDVFRKPLYGALTCTRISAHCS
jgi:hypothetical protein